MMGAPGRCIKRDQAWHLTWSAYGAHRAHVNGGHHGAITPERVSS
jgi:hypothetical protein